MKKALLVSLSFGWLAACSKVVGVEYGGSATSAIKTDRVNVRSFDQLNETMAVLTGVPVSAVAPTYNRDESGAGLRGYLPANNSLKEFNGSQQGAIFRLATSYCDLYTSSLTANSYANLKAQYPFFGSSFSDSIDQDFDQNKINQLTESFYKKFWGACLRRPDLDATKSEILSLVADLKNDFAQQPTNNKPSNYIRIMCSVFLSSSCVSFF